MGVCSCYMLRVLFMFLTILKKKTFLLGPKLPLKWIQILDFSLSLRIPFFYILCNALLVSLLKEFQEEATLLLFLQLNRIWWSCSKWLCYVSNGHLYLVYNFLSPLSLSSTEAKLSEYKAECPVSLSSVLITWLGKKKFNVLSCSSHRKSSIRRLKLPSLFSKSIIQSV